MRRGHDSINKRGNGLTEQASRATSHEAAPLRRRQSAADDRGDGYRSGSGLAAMRRAYDIEVDAGAIRWQSGRNTSVWARKAEGAVVGQLGKLRPIGNRPTGALKRDGGGRQPPRRLPAWPTAPAAVPLPCRTAPRARKRQCAVSSAGDNQRAPYSVRWSGLPRFVQSQELRGRVPNWLFAGRLVQRCLAFPKPLLASPRPPFRGQNIPLLPCISL
jgi:hypothetical protein